MEIVVAVYGTLKKGFYNHYLLENSKFLGKAISEGKFSLGEYFYPAVALSKEGAPIEVELYEVTERTLRRLDVLEGYPHFYNRDFFNFRMGERIVKAYLYFLMSKTKPFSWKNINTNEPSTWTISGWELV